MALNYACGITSLLAADTVGTTRAVSGLGFQPKALRFSCNGHYSATDSTDAPGSGAQNCSLAIAASASSRYCVGWSDAAGATTSATGRVTRDDCICCLVGSGGASNGRMDISSIDADGFTLICDQVAGQDGSIFWEAWGGSDITDVTCSTITEPAATGAVSYSATNFTADGKDQVVMFLGGAPTALNTGAGNDGIVMIGAIANGSQFVWAGFMADGVGTTNTACYHYASDCLANYSSAGAIDAQAQFSAWAAGQFTLNWSARATTGRIYPYLAIKGGTWDILNDGMNATTLNNTHNFTGQVFTPSGVCLLGSYDGYNASATPTANLYLFMGAAASASSRWASFYLNASAQATVVIYQAIEYDAVHVYSGGVPSVLSLIDVNSVQDGGITFIIDDAVAKDFPITLMFFGSTAQPMDIIGGRGIIPVPAHI